MVQYLLYRITRFVVNHVPLDLSYWIADRVADLHFAFSGKSRRQVLTNLRLLRDEKSLPENQAARQVFQNFGKQIVDFLRLSQIDRKRFLDAVEIEGLEHIQNSLRQGKGVIGVTAHFGNWEWGAAGLSLLGFPVHALVLHQSNRRVNELFNNERSGKGIHVIPMTKSVSVWDVASTLAKRNEILLLAADRDISSNGVPVSFLGRDFYLPRGPAALSRRCGSPLIVGFVVRHAKGCFRLTFAPPVEVERTKNPICDIQRMTQKVANIMEAVIRRYPTQWFLFEGLREADG